MDLGSKVISDVIVFSKYARFRPDLNRRETWDEIVDRYQECLTKKYPAQAENIEWACQFIRRKEILPSMRFLQFAGKPIEKQPVRAYNCAYAPVDDYHVFSEAMYLLLCGTGFGYSVRKRHISKLPVIHKPTSEQRYLVGDSIEGWADAVKVLMKAYMCDNKPRPLFDYRDIRAKGTNLSSGGLAPGPDGLRTSLDAVEKILLKIKPGEQLSSLDVNDILCFLSNAVLSGGLRRSACIVLFDHDDELMLNCKVGDWYIENSQRGRANNSLAFIRSETTREHFDDAWTLVKKALATGSGDPGISWTNDADYGYNPCQPGFAEVITPEGIKTLDQIGEGSLIWSSEGWTQVVKKWSTGVKPVYSYNTTASNFIGTENHRILQHGSKIPVGEATYMDSLRGPNYDHIINYDPQLIMDGLVLGDGGFHVASNYLRLLYVGKYDQDYLDSEIAPYLIRHRPGITKEAWEVKTGLQVKELGLLPYRSIPTRYYSASHDEICSFLRGLYTANGSLCGGRVTLKSSCYKLITQVRTMLSSIGIRSYYTTNKETDVKFSNGIYTCKQSYDLNITVDSHIFERKIGFIQKYKVSKLQEYVDKRSINHGKTTYDIKDKKYIGDYEVFDITVDNDSHTYWSAGTNVSNCFEASLYLQFCNLTSINVTSIRTRPQFKDRTVAATILGTLQAGFTDFYYLRNIWKTRTEADALLGVGLNGLANKKFLSNPKELREMANVMLEVNKTLSEQIGINPASRLSVVKPEGSGSLVCGVWENGIHPRRVESGSKFIRRMRVTKVEPIYHYFKLKCPDLVEDEKFDPENTAVISFPIDPDENGLGKEEPSIDFLNRIKEVYQNWIVPGHRTGPNTHNCSATIDIKPEEYDEVGEWLWDNRESYMGLSFLPYSNVNYPQLPFEACDDETYEKMFMILANADINISEITEDGYYPDFQSEGACMGGSCQINAV